MADNQTTMSVDGRDSLSALATDLWGELDTEIAVPGVLDHELVIPLIRAWFLDHRDELREALA